MNKEKYSPFDKTAPSMIKSVPTSSMPILLARPTLDEVTPRSPVDSTTDSSNVINNSRMTCFGTHREEKTLTRVLLKTDNPWSGETPFAGNRECFNEHFSRSEGLLDERTLVAATSDEMEEERPVLDAVISVRHESEESSSPMTPATIVLSTPAPPTLSELPTSAVAPRQPSDDQIPPVKVMPRRYGQRIVSKTMGVYSLHSPSLETARKQSITSIDSSSVEGEGQLARAATYILERRTRRSCAFDEFPRRSSRLPPDKPLEVALTAIEPRRLRLDVVDKEVEASVTSVSPLCRPESTKRSHSSKEAAPGLLDLNLAASVTDCQDSKPRQTRQAVEVIRCSDEHLKTEDSVSKEPVMPAPRILEDEWFAGPTERQSAFSVVSKIQTSAFPHLPIRRYSSDIVREVTRSSLSLHSCKKIRLTIASQLLIVTRASPTLFDLFVSTPFPQAVPSSQLSFGLDRLIEKPPNDGDCEKRPHKVVCSSNIPRAAIRSLEAKTGVMPPVSKPSVVWASFSRCLSVELCWRARCPPKDGTLQSCRLVPKRHVLNVVSTGKVGSNATYRPWRTQPKVSLRLSSSRPGGLLLQVSSIRRKNHNFDCSVSRVSTKTFISQSDMTPSEGVRERSKECSNDDIGHAVKQALALSSSKEGEERQTYVAVISIQRKSEGQLSPNTSTAFRPPAVTSVPSLVLPAQTAIPPPTRDEPMPPSEAVTRRYDLNIVCKIPTANDKPHSQSSETARRQSVTIGHPPEATERKWLDRTATYIRERRNARSSTDDEFVRQPSKVPPDKMTAPVTLRHVLNVVSENEKASEKPRSPGVCPESYELSQSLPEVVSPHCSSLSLHSCKKIRFTVTNLSPVSSTLHAILSPLPSSESVVSQQAVPSDWSSPDLSRLNVKSFHDGDREQRPSKAVSSTNGLNARLHSPEVETRALRPVSKHDSAQVSLPCIMSLEGWWRVRCKPPNIAVEPERRNSNVVSKTIDSSATKHLPPAKAAFGLPRSSVRSLRMCNLRYPRPELVWRVLKPPNWAAIRRSLNRVVDKFELRRRTSCLPLSSTLASSSHVFSCLQTAIEISL